VDQPVALPDGFAVPMKTMGQQGSEDEFLCAGLVAVGVEILDA
jgi:hypothetical protein